MVLFAGWMIAKLRLKNVGNGGQNARTKYNQFACCLQSDIAPPADFGWHANWFFFRCFDGIHCFIHLGLRADLFQLLALNSLVPKLHAREHSFTLDIIKWQLIRVSFNIPGLCFLFH
jgi:hypothetical protein